jgi:23S rRNA-/tRNA-specific pseudouridylate synthase
LNIIYEDEHLIVVNKPGGVLTVSGKDKTYHSLVQTVYDYCNNNTTKTNPSSLKDADHMVVHRLAMDTSGLIIFAKNIETVRGLNTIFRTRDIDRTYEALVCGHIPNKKGRINLPLMRDYEHPLYVRISTDRHQEMLLNLDATIVGKKLLEQPKESVTEYKVLNYETLNGQPVTRILLRSVSGRMHQLNCHLATIGHPIVGDVAYGGINDMALPNGGLSDDELEYMIPSQYNNKQNRVSIEQQLQTNVNILHPTCHANMIQFRHPITKQQITLQSDAPF